MNKERKKVLILFSGPHLAYSPTTINLYDFLSPHFDVEIIAVNPVNFNNQKLQNRKVIYYDVKSKGRRFINRFLFEVACLFNREARFFKKHQLFIGDYFYPFRFIKNYFRSNSPDFIIAIDFQNLLYCQLLNKRIEFLSLELVENKYSEACHFENINSVIIQSQERFDYIFKNKLLKTFIIQNAPVYTGPPEPKERKGIVYCGTAWDAFGFYHCLEYLKKYPGDQITVQGAVLKDAKAKIENEYQFLVDEKRLLISSQYLEESEVVPFLASYKAGLVFYNFDVPLINNFNYISAPSGKLFKYLAAGVPVIAQNIIGMKCVKDFECGVLIESLDPESIRQAVLKIEANFETYSANCLKAAAHYSFDKNVEPFVDYLKVKAGYLK